MDDTRILAECERLAHRLGITVRTVRGGPEGLCTIHGERVLFLDPAGDTRSLIDVYVRAFKSLDLGGLFVAPVLRRLMGGMDGDPDGW